MLESLRRKAFYRNKYIKQKKQIQLFLLNPKSKC